MEITRTEIYDQPDSEGWWWNEGNPDPILVLEYCYPDLKTAILCSPDRNYPGDYLGKWQKVQPPIWPTPATEYDKNFGDDQVCECGHPYYRHFDTYEDMEPVGCKYCPCRTFKGEFSA